MAITAETALARITEQLAQRHSTSVPFDTVRRSLRASKTELTAAVNELVAGGYVHNDTDLGVITAMGEGAFDVEAVGEAGVAYDSLPETPAIDEDYRDDSDQGHDPTQVGGDNDDPDFEVGDDEADDEDRPSRTIVPAKYRAQYKETRNTCGDELAYAITDYVNDVIFTPRQDGKGNKKVKALNLTALAQLAADNGIEPDAIKGNNNGQRRMNLSNMLRGMLRNGKDVTVDGVVFKGEAKPKTRKDWIDATMAAWLDDEPELSQAHAKARAVKEWDARIADGQAFNPVTGRFDLEESQS